MSFVFAAVNVWWSSEEILLAGVVCYYHTMYRVSDIIRIGSELERWQHSAPEAQLKFPQKSPKLAGSPGSNSLREF
jgi:hypothetical protein